MYGTLPVIRHPDGLYCPVCGCPYIVLWPEILEEWDSWTPEQKAQYEVCACCGYGDPGSFPEEEEEPLGGP